LIILYYRSPCTDIYVNFNNNGVVPVEWKYQFPNDLQNDIEKWAKGEVTSEEQLKINMILDNQLFSITPKVNKKNMFII